MYFGWQKFWDVVAQICCKYSKKLVNIIKKFKQNP